MRTVDWARNMIKTDGHYSPFVYPDTDGIHIGDCDNHEIFGTITEALAYANKARLHGTQLTAGERASNNDMNGNAAAEYRWHQDAAEQIAALNALGAVG